nr:unnamed protein product [Callosobruchus chinensis]
MFIKQICPKGLSRKEQVLLCRLRIGYTNLTHSHLLNRDPLPRCTRCNGVLPVEHIPIYCTLYEHIRHSLQISTNMNILSIYFTHKC